MRDNRLDVIRGLSILLLTMTHTVPGPQLLEQFGHYYIITGFFFHGADIFVSFSGLICGIVYKRTVEKLGPKEGIRKGLTRAVQLMFFNVVAFTLVYIIIVSFGAWGVQAQNHGIEGSHIGAIFGSIFLYDPIPYFNILNLYIVFLVILPFFVVAQMRSNVPILTCLTLYVLYSLYLKSGGDYLTKDVFFVSPFTWQLVFFGGAFVGMNYDAIRSKLPPLRSTIGPIMFYALISHFMRDMGWAVHHFTSKFELGFLRIIDLILFAYLIDRLVSPSIPITSRAMQYISSVGSNSLFCFSFTLVMCYFFSHVLSIFDGSRAIYLGALLVEVLIMIQLGRLLLANQAFRKMTQVKWIDQLMGAKTQA